MILTSVLPGVMIGYGHGVTDKAVSIFVVKVIMESDVCPGTVVFMSSPRKSGGGVKLAFEMCAYFVFNIFNCFSVSCDQGIINVEKDKTSAVFIKVSINARFIGTGLESY